MKLFLVIVLFVADVIVADPTGCFSCVASDAATCLTSSALLQNQTCSNPDSSCGSANITYLDSLSGQRKSGVFYGCIDCADKKTACEAIGSHLNKSLLECEVKCCNNNSYCNNPAFDVLQCNFCNEPSVHRCQFYPVLHCGVSPRSLGVSQCGSAAARYLDKNGLKHDLFYRGCFDRVGKKAACFALGGYLKGDDTDAGQYTLLNCEINFCSGKICDRYGQRPKLSPSSITVFTPTVSGPTQCKQCLTNNATSCLENLQTQVCATNPFSLGTTHCGSAIGKYRDLKGNVVDGFLRGCINCEDKKAACAAIGGFLKNVRGWTQLECEIECCTGEHCNTPTPGGSTTPPPPTASGKDQHTLLSGMLALTTAFASIFS